jgi:SNF2 family DNA or RNA helicase
VHYTPDDGNLVQLFYVPALCVATHYDRTTGYFTASALTLAARGIEALVRNRGKMRLLVGCTLAQAEIDAITKGETLAAAVERTLLQAPFDLADADEKGALELLAWMVAHGYLEVKVAVPCDEHRRPVRTEAIFHTKTGILEDRAGNRIAFSGSINETRMGWTQNFESFHVYTSWGGAVEHVDSENATFRKQWAGHSYTLIVMDVPTAVREKLLEFAPPAGTLPARVAEDTVPYGQEEVPALPTPEVEIPPRRLVWGFLKHAPAMPNGGERIGEATCPIEPWPHQVRAFQRMYDSWPTQLLIADEVGLGKTIEAGLLLRQAWLSGRAKRILILAPKALLRQWQVELREKFNLNWPIFDGHRLAWYPSPALNGRHERPAGNADWHHEPVVITSSQLMRRTERAQDMLAAEPWDLVILDEAHHARRKGVGSPRERGPNKLLHLMQSLRSRTKAMVMLTATPMQVDPIEVWDLLHLLGLPSEWSAAAFQQFFELAAKPNPSHEEFEALARLFRASEKHFGAASHRLAVAHTGGDSFRANKMLSALRDRAQFPRKQLQPEDRRAALAIMRGTTPVARLISRHTRELLRKYHKAGKLTAQIADREVRDVFIQLSNDERDLYDAVEHYISTTYNKAEARRRNAVGFVMTIYRRRLASSFFALQQTMQARLAKQVGWSEEDVDDDEIGDDPFDVPDEVMVEPGPAIDEPAAIRTLLERIVHLPLDTKLGTLKSELATLRANGYRQVMIFTQYTDTMDFLRRELAKDHPAGLMCFSGRGGEVLQRDGSWISVTRDDVKKRFAERAAEYLLCTDAAAEGLNFQFCGALVNYDMPWNPMRVEQRIGRIDRLGQEYPRIQIVNLHYEDTVEADVYRALAERIQLFRRLVGKLQPILAKLPSRISEAVLRPGDRGHVRSTMLSQIESEAAEAEVTAFDLDEATSADLGEPSRPSPHYSMADIDQVLRRADLLPPGIAARDLSGNVHQYALSMPGQSDLRITTDNVFYEQHSDSCELWSPGSPAFEFPEDVADEETVQNHFEDAVRVLRSAP